MKLLRALLAAVGMKKTKTQERVGNSTKDTSGPSMLKCNCTVAPDVVLWMDPGGCELHYGS